jgi:hypothetical protein
MDFNEILSAILAGGIAGQLTTLLLGARYTAKREFDNWLRTERFRTFSELISLISAVATREDYDTWPDEIRVLSQRVHLLFKSGTAPNSIASPMQELFSLALKMKLGKVKDEKEWRSEIREEARKLREGFAHALHSNHR